MSVSASTRDPVAPLEPSHLLAFQALLVVSAGDADAGDADTGTSRFTPRDLWGICCLFYALTPTGAVPLSTLEQDRAHGSGNSRPSGPRAAAEPSAVPSEALSSREELPLVCPPDSLLRDPVL